jgi:Mg2+ and Co2+ transporter CorA
MTPHEAAQSLWWFVAIVMVGIAVVLFIDYRKEKRDD